ncbi:hypothetical protein F4808DRAFT_54554 [Astrocystis sublimbata]|nr:hypothetical protein F4808DRAFT_54554 [Astrocystis sublimbata]
MRVEQISQSPSFEIHGYQHRAGPSFATDHDLSVTKNAFWSYCGPLLEAGTDLPPDFYEWTSVALSCSLHTRLTPFLAFANEVLRQHGLDHYWLTVRATKATSDFDEPRWHTDEMFFSTRGGGLRAMPREDDGDNTLDLQTDWKLCTTLLGPSTMFIPVEYQTEARDTQQATRKHLATEHDCTSIRCIACAATSESVRERLSTQLKHMGAVQATIGECTFFRIGQKKGAVHSEPCMSGGDRIFVNIVPGRKAELKSLMNKWGMDFPRSWWIAPSVSRS